MKLKANISISLMPLIVLLTTYARADSVDTDEIVTGPATQIEKEVKEEVESSPKNERIQVWGTRISTSSTQLSDDEIAQRQAHHISDLLRILPGVDVGGSHSLNQRITIRGMEDQDINVTIDGARQNSYMYHHMGNLQIHADILKSADIEVGKNSILTSELGGAAKFETKSASDLLDPGSSWGGVARLSYLDNWGTSYAATGYGKVSDTVDLLAYYNTVERVNFRVGGGEIKDQNDEKIAGTDGKVRGLEGTLDDYLVKSGWNISDNHRIEISREYYNDHGNYSYRPDMGIATDLVITNTLNVPMTYPTDFSRETSILKYKGDLANTLVTASVFQNKSTLERDEAGLAGWNPGAAGMKEGIADNLGASVLAQSRFTAVLPQVLRYGGEYTEYTTSFSKDGRELSAEKAFLSGFYLEDQLTLADTLRLTAGVRQDHANLDANLNDGVFSGTSYALKADYDIISNLTAGLSATELFKAPEIGEVFVGAGMNDRENPDIEAETGINAEFTLQYSQKFSSLGSFNGGATLFQTDINDYIYDYAPYSDTPNDLWKDNIGDLKIEGSELYFGFSNTNVSAMITYSKAESELSAFERYKALDGARNYREQGDTTALSFDYRFLSQALTLHFDSRNVARLTDAKDLDNTSLDEANSKDGFLVHNISARWLPKVAGNEFDLTLGVDNLTDEYISSQSSRNGLSFHPLFKTLYLTDYEPGRTIKTTVGYRF